MRYLPVSKPKRVNLVIFSNPFNQLCSIHSQKLIFFKLHQLLYLARYFTGLFTTLKVNFICTHQIRISQNAHKCKCGSLIEILSTKIKSIMEDF